MEAMEKFRQCVENHILELKKIFEENRNLIEGKIKQTIIGSNMLDQMRNQQVPFILKNLYEKEKECMNAMFEKLSVYKNFLHLAEFHEHYLFRDFYTLGLYLENISLNTVEKLQILITFIEGNIKIGLLAEDNISRIPVYQFVTISQKEAIEFYAQDQEDLEKLQSYIKGNVTSTCKVIPCSTSADGFLLQATHQVIQKCYLEKLDTYTIEDMNQTIGAFRELGISEQLCEAIRTKLKKELQKRNDAPILNYQNNTQVKYSNRLTDREYKKVLKQIRSCYNEYTGEFLVELTEDQIHNLASLMIQLDYNRKTINQFYKDAEKKKKLQCMQKPLSSEEEFIKLYQKIEFYSENDLELKELVEDAITYLYETFGCRKEDYNFWYQEFQNIVFNLKMRIPNTFDYEYAQAQALLEQRQKQKLM